jgi:hypothetical protein
LSSDSMLTFQAEDDDFEVVPIEKEDGIEWDVEDEDQDVVKQEKIKSTYCEVYVDMSLTPSQRRVS